MSAVYFGGSRSLPSCPLVGQVVHAVFSSGQSIHVGCQRGADQQVVQAALAAGGQSFLVVFAVEAPLFVPAHVAQAFQAGAQLIFQAGGSAAPMRARYLLRSLAGLAGCSAAVFFWPGPGSLAVASHAVRLGRSVFAFGPMPSPIPYCAGAWVVGSFRGFSCWLWHPAAVQQSLF